MRINRTLLASVLGEVNLSLEDQAVEATAAKTEVELELTYYGRLTDVSQLEAAATRTHQEQWHIKAPSTEQMRYGGSVRARALDGERFILCIKNFEKGKRGVLEHEFEINQEAFEQIKRISETGMIKTRYTFPIEGTSYNWEVDVFTDPETKEPYAWVKVDLEIDDPSYQIPDMPFHLEGCFRDNPVNRTDEQQRLIDGLMSRFFVTPNMYTAEE